MKLIVSGLLALLTALAVPAHAATLIPKPPLAAPAGVLTVDYWTQPYGWYEPDVRPDRGFLIAPAYEALQGPAGGMPRIIVVVPRLAQPWSQQWYEACFARYRSFDPQSGTYLGYDGARHFCR